MAFIHTHHYNLQSSPLSEMAYICARKTQFSTAHNAKLYFTGLEKCVFTLLCDFC